MPPGRFDYVLYDEQSRKKQEAFKNLFTALEDLGNQVLPDDDAISHGRAKNLFFTSLEEAYMWAGKAIRDEQLSGGSQMEHLENRSEG